MYISTKVFQHLKWLKKAVVEVDGEAFINVTSFTAEVRLGNKVYMLHPMFAAIHEGKRVYTYQFGPEAHNFIGWKPYVNRETPEIGKKLTFKRFVTEAGLETPEYSTTDNKVLQNVIVKKDISSFGSEIQGPFNDNSQYKLDVDGGEYFECFTQGEIVKIWYWNEKPIVMEGQDMPAITGDGKSTVKQLIESYYARIKNGFGEINWQQVEDILQHQNVKLDNVLNENVTRLIDFRYISAFSEPDKIRSTLFKEKTLQHDPLFVLGDAIKKYLLQQGKRNTLYSIDAILDKNGVFNFLEVNFNPATHPCVYQEMIKSLRDSSVYKQLQQVAQ